MNSKKILCIFFWGLLFISTETTAQDRIAQIRQELDSLSAYAPGLLEETELSVKGSLTEFIRGLGKAHGLNFNVEPRMDYTISNSFSNVQVKDVVVFLCKTYDLSLDYTGTIISFKKHIAPIEVQQVAPPKIGYNKRNNFLSLDLKLDSIQAVARRITDQTPHNVILAPGLSDKRMSVFIKNRPFDDALEKMAYANGLEVTKTPSGFYLLQEQERPQKEIASAKGKSNRRRKSGTPISPSEVKDGELFVDVNEDTLITVNAREVSVSDVIKVVSEETFKNYFIYSEPQGRTSLYMENTTYDHFLSHLLNGSGFAFKKDRGVYLIGQQNIDGLRTSLLVELENRTVESIVEFIPAELKKDVEIKEFIELNGLILSGSLPRIYEIRDFVKQLDKIVPVVMIDVIITDVNKTRNLSAGLNLGLGNPPETTGGTIQPATNIDLTSESINDLISGFNGFGLVNLGKVAPNFYANLQALESDGVLKMRSTPKLSTLNGHEANLSIGRTEYYLEVSNDVIGSQNPTITTSQNYKSVNANLSITIKPTVSGQEQVTLDITVSQSDFTERISETAPPGSVTRDFKSLIRVRNGDLILLGGLEDKSVNNSGSGLPFLSRIPLIKWFFGSRSTSKSKSKLNIFIKPTVIY